MLFQPMLMSIVTYPVKVRASGLKTGLVLFLLIVCVVMSMCISMWSRMPTLIDEATHGKTDLVGRFEAMKPAEDHALKMRAVVVLAVTVLVTLAVWLFLPQLGSSTLSFDQFSDKYQVTEVKPGSGFDRSLLDGSGSSFKVNGGGVSSYPVEWIPDDSSLVKTGTIQVTSGKARLVSDDGPQPALK